MRVFFLFTLLSLSLVGCTTVPVPELAVTQINQCAEPLGVSLKLNTLTITLGERPSLGYGVELLSLEQKGERLRLSYREKKPAQQNGKREKTHPCVQLKLPNGWQILEVVEQDSGQRVRLTPKDDSLLGGQ
ncbi:MAG: hypothetical protein RL217_589 [Pseudomonadota bacterium]|jgi:hypothetical protein